MSLNDHVLDFILHTTWADLPAAVQHQARRCLLDLTAATLAGTQTPVARIMAEFALAQCKGEEATILGSGRRASLIGAALANGFAANALDIDDGYRPVKGHPGVCVLPALLAASEAHPPSGPAFLTALVIGYEIGQRAGLIRHAGAAVYHASGSWGALAAAAAAGRILGLDRQSLYEALGTAEYHAPIAPMMKGIARPDMGKDATGWGGMAGLAAALLAAQGFTGVDPLFADAADPGWVTELGQRWRILDLYFKPYACCRWAQPAIAAVLRIAKQAHFTPAEIAGIHVRTFAAAASLSRDHPRHTEDAQYNLAFPIAAALIDGELGPRQVSPPRLCDPDLLALADRVQVEVAPDYEALFPAQAWAEVTVQTQGGQSWSSGPAQARWEPPDSPTDADLFAKFHWLLDPLLGPDAAAALARHIWELPENAACSAFLHALHRPLPSF